MSQLNQNSKMLSLFSQHLPDNDLLLDSAYIARQGLIAEQLLALKARRASTQSRQCHTVTLLA